MVEFNDEQKEYISKVKSNALRDYVPILKDESMQLISMILSLKKPNKILEIGSAVGYSSVCFSRYLCDADSKITTIEIDDEMYNVAKKNIYNMGLDKKIEIIHADATEYLPKMEEKEYFDVIFIDAAKGQYLKFLDNALRLIKNGGVIIADNVLFKGMVLSDYNEHKHRTAVNRLRQYLRIIKENQDLDSYIFNIR